MQAVVLWRATRSYSLPASVVPVFLGTVLAARGFGGLGAHFNWVTFIVVLIGAILAHFGANILNDYFDFLKGVDTRPEHGSGVLTSGQMKPAQALAFALMLFGGAAICGIALLRTNPAIVISLGLSGLACAVLYPAFLKKYGLGDVLIVLAFGFGLTLGAYGVQLPFHSGHQVLLIAFFALPICLLVDAILHANNLRDAADDRAANVWTLATALPISAARWLQQLLLFGPLLFVVVSVLIHLLPVWSLGTFLALPFLLRASRSESVPGTAQAHLIFGVFYTASFLFSPTLD